MLHSFCQFNSQLRSLSYTGIDNEGGRALLAALQVNNSLTSCL